MSDQAVREPKIEKLDGEALRNEGKRWLERIEAAATKEKTWLDDAARAGQAYTGEGKNEHSDALDGNNYDFNILFSNVETIVPAVINSPPAPDIRRRFGQDDTAARDFAEMLERACRVQVDDGKLQVELEAMAQDGFLAGRGIVRIRFFDAKDGRNERIGFEAVSWRDYRHGPAKRWEDRPWDAFRHAIVHDDMDEFGDEHLIRAQSEAAGEKPGEPDEADKDADIFVWEIWNQKTREVIFVREHDATIVKRISDPLGLSNFFCIATPVQPIEVTGRLMPVNPFSIYRRLAEELDLATKRINVITEQLKVKGWYAAASTEFQRMLDADDNEFIPIEDGEKWAGHGGLQGAIAFWPVEKLILVLKELYALRDQTKTAIYEITGISDIVRGASKAQETLGAQQIKSQWGSLRIQKMQRMMERAARDLFVMMSEIIPSKFSIETLQAMTEIQLQASPEDLQPTTDPAQQAAQQEEIAHYGRLQAMLHEKGATYYRIDVETDSTVKADLTRQKEEATGFMTAASGYFQAVAPLVQQGALPMNVAVEIFSSFSRLFNLGKTVEDALDELVNKAKEMAAQPAGAAADPAKQAAEAESAAKAKAIEQDAQIKGDRATIDLQTAQIEQEGKKIDNQTKGVELQIKQADLAMRHRQAMAAQAAFTGFSGLQPMEAR